MPFLQSAPGSIEDAASALDSLTWGQTQSTAAGGGGAPAEVSEMVMVVKDCDRNTLDYLLNVSRSISGNVEIKITLR
jgi:hypothetical protein